MYQQLFVIIDEILHDSDTRGIRIHTIELIILITKVVGAYHYSLDIIGWLRTRHAIP